MARLIVTFGKNMAFGRPAFGIAAVYLAAMLVFAACGEGPAPTVVTRAESTATPAAFLAAPPVPSPTSIPSTPVPVLTVVAVVPPPSTPTPSPTPVPTVASTPISVAPQEPTATVTPTVTSPPQAPTPTPAPVTNGAVPLAEEAALTQAGGITTVEVVKALRPVVVQITTRQASLRVGSQPIPSGVGTGIILDETGHILTNRHVVEGTQRVIVTLHNGQSFEATPVGGDFQTNIAVIKIEAEGLQPATLGTSATLEVGEDVIAIGHALGLKGGPSVSKGVVSAIGRTIETDPLNSVFITDLIQTDASINPGNSGGPLVNNSAEVIGINTAIIQQSQGIGFALNIDDVKVVVVQLLDQGFVTRGFLGITPENITSALAAQFSLPVTEGILIVRTITGSSAEAAGLLAGDIIQKLGDQEISNTGELSKFLLEHPPGESVAVEYLRRGRAERTIAILGDRPR